jgi:hypothetical protein
MALAVAGVMSLPVSSFARTIQDPQPQPQPQQQQPPAQPQPEQPQPSPATPQQPTPTPQQPAPTPQQPAPTAQPSPSATQTRADQALTPQDHVKKAQEAVKDINETSIPAKNRSALAELKQHLSNLEKLSASGATSTPAEMSKKAPGAKSSEAPNWATEVGAADKMISQLMGDETSISSTPRPTGTSGTTDKSATAVDDATRAKLTEVRTHITAYAAAMAGTSTPKTEAAANPESPAARPEPSMTPASAQPSSAAPSPTPSPAQPDPNAAPSAQAPTSQQPAAQPPAAQPPTAQPPAAPSAQQSAAGQPPAAAQAQPQVDTEAAHRHLVTAREALSQLTQLPAASQLSGEARNQVSQLITNFNELITTQSNWRASYDKVAANLTALLGPDNSDTEAAAGAPPANPAAASTPGAVGTAGTATTELDPAIRAKLVEFRNSVNEFRKAAGGEK